LLGLFGLGWWLAWPPLPHAASQALIAEYEPLNVRQNALELYLAGAALARDAAQPEEGNYKWNLGPNQRQLMFLKTNPKALALLVEGQNYPLAQLVAPDGEIGLERTMALYPALRTLIGLGGMAAWAELAQGEQAIALTHAAATLDAGFKLAITPGAGLVQMSLMQSLLLAPQITLIRHLDQVVAAPPDVLASFVRSLDDIHAREHPAEEIVTCDYFAARSFMRGIGNLDEPGMAARFSDWYGFSAFGSPERLTSQLYARYLELLRLRDFAALEREFAPAVRFGHEREALAMLFHPPEATAATLARALHEGVKKTVPNWLLTQCRLESLRLRLALFRYGKDHAGQAPATLGALVPMYLPAIPQDPCKPDRPIRYKEGHLYRVGFDGEDQGGTPAIAIDDPYKQPGLDDRGDFAL
jgi:hypothetical protein